MTSFKLILRNVQKNIRDYLIYFLTLTLSVSLFYAFNSISDQPAFSDMGMTGSLLYDQLGILLSALSVVIAVVLAFLIIYANQFLFETPQKGIGRIYDAWHEKRAYFPAVCWRNHLRWYHCFGLRLDSWMSLFAGTFFGCIKALCD